MIEKLDEQTKTVLYHHLSPFYGGILLHKIEEMIDAINNRKTAREERLQQLEKVLILRGIYTTVLENQGYDESGTLRNVEVEYNQELERLKEML